MPDLRQGKGYGNAAPSVMLSLTTMKIAVNVGKAPEEKTSKNGRVYWSFRAADNQKNGNEQKTNWFWVNYFGDDEPLVVTLRVGDRVEVDGILDFAPYERRDGSLDAGASIACFKLVKVPKKEEGKQAEGSSKPEGKPAGEKPSSEGQRNNSRESLPSDNFDDDIPF
jgi:single-stranded DNA-binding protein